MNELDDGLLALLAEDALLEQDRILPQPGSASAPLSYSQQRLWLLQELAPTSTAYNLTRAFHLQGQVDAAALEQAFKALIARHAVLRTRFEAVAGEPRQIVLDEVPLALTAQDHPQVPAEARVEILRQGLEAEAQRPFDLRQAPLLRVTWLRFAADSHGLLLAMHHIVSDAWSNPLLVRDLAAFYEAALARRQAELPPLPVQYADFARWQREQWQGNKRHESLAYWQQYLGRELPALELPTDHPRPAQQSERGQRLRFTLPAELITKVQGFCRAEACTPFVVLLAAWQILLARYSGQQEFALGVPQAARSRPELEELIGFFVNTLVYRVQLTPDLTARAMCQRLRQESLAALEHAEVPFELLLERMQVTRDPSRSPLFQALFNLSTGAPVRLRLADADAELLQTAAEESAKFDLTLDVAVQPDGVRYELEYKLDLFLSATIERLAGHFRQVLDALVSQPECLVWRLPLLAETERRQVLEGWNRSELELSASDDMLARFEAQAQSAPERCALICGAERLSYSELNARANRLARYLRAAGVQRDELVGVCMEREAELLVSLLAIHKAGGAYLPIDPAQPPARNADILAQAAPRLVLCREALRAAVGEGRAIATLEVVLPTLTTFDPSDLQLPVHPRQLAYCLYTSGSTGRPKGVQIERQALANFLRGIQAHADISIDDRLLAITTLGFDIAGLELFLPLVQGACVVLATREQALHPATLLALMEEQAITDMQATPATWQMLVEQESPAWSGLRVLCGGEALGAELAGRLLARGVNLTNVYGPTETTVWSSAQPVTQVDAAVMPIGRPLANNHLYILDEYLEPQPPGVTGELYIGGAGLARAYAGRPELTAQAFIPNPFSRSDAPGAEAGSRLYRTGDLARFRSDGSVDFLGRRDFQVKLRGFRIELGEIESALETHPGIQQAVVALRCGPAGQEVLVAYLRSREALAPAELSGYLRDRLPAYMLPAAFVSVESFPLNANGKVDRRALPEWSAAAGEAAELTTDTERRLARIWEEVLGVSGIGAQDELFALGAQSLQLVRIQARLRQEFGGEPPLAALFANPRLSAMAALIEQSGSANADDELALIDSLLAAYE